MSELDKNMDDSREWVNETINWFFPFDDPLAKQPRADSLIEALASLRFYIHSWLRHHFKLEDRVKELEEFKERVEKEGLPTLWMVRDRQRANEECLRRLEDRVALLERGRSGRNP